jgi:hypothetical protein
MPPIRRAIKKPNKEIVLAKLAEGKDPNAKPYEVRTIQMAILSMVKHE